MSTLIIAGDHPRHRSILESLIPQMDKELRLMLYKRESLEPRAPEFSSQRESRLWDFHFELRKHVEDRYFGSESTEELSGKFIEVDRATREDFTRKLGDVLSTASLDGLLVVGSGMVDAKLLPLMPSNSFNLHLGLSPRYRGSATLFWPSYFLEPEFSGTTLHKFSEAPDSGEIVHQTAIDIQDVDWNIHESAAETITQSLPEVGAVLRRALNSEAMQLRPQPIAGKTFLTTDFRPEHLVPIYETFHGSVISFVSREIGRTWKKPLLFKANLREHD